MLYLSYVQVCQDHVVTSEMELALPQKLLSPLRPLTLLTLLTLFTLLTLLKVITLLMVLTLLNLALLLKNTGIYGYIFCKMVRVLWYYG